ncbi:hypothetical protein ACP3TC_04805 [Winslowiella sp. 2C04]|uniref:hypothetical protein n=1 Tax=Winslowiella sp. 2C04 TaxID=3416179 RepID=UPI003CFB3FA8
MAKSSAERKAEQRARQAESGIKRLDLTLDAQEVQMLEQNCAARRPFRDPYDINEYLSLLIRKDNADLQQQLAELNNRCCEECKDKLPGDPNGCYFQSIGDSECWQTFGWHDLKL